MSESETGIVCCEDIGKYKIRTRDRGSNERGGNNICVNVCKKGRNSSRFGLEEDIIRSCGMSCGQAVFG